MNQVSYIKLSELSRKIQAAISHTFSDETWWIVAEISGHKYYPNRDSHYFDLVEKMEGSNVEAAKVHGKAWKEGSEKIFAFERQTGQNFSNGLEVLIRVKVEYHIVFGLSVTLLDIDYAFTLGNIEKQRRNTLERLVKENPDFIQLAEGEYLTHNKKLRHRNVIQYLAVIASNNSEGYKDFHHTLTENPFGYKFSADYYFSSVQGGEAEKELVNTLIRIFRSGKNYDSVVIVRGGGAKTDFLVFDTYNLSRAVAKFPIPIITGIGHLNDVSIVDLMCHSQMKTPTKAAEFIISHNRNFEDRLVSTERNLVIKIQQYLGQNVRDVNTVYQQLLSRTRTMLDRNKDSLSRKKENVIVNTGSVIHEKRQNLLSVSTQLTSRPLIRLNEKISHLENHRKNIISFTNKYLQTAGNFLVHYESVIRLMSPKELVKRGFALVSRKGKIVKDANEINPGEEITISISDTEILSKVISKNKKDGKNDL